MLWINAQSPDIVHVIFLCGCLLPLIMMLLGLCIAAVINILHTVDHGPIVVPFVFANASIETAFGAPSIYLLPCDFVRLST